MNAPLVSATVGMSALTKAPLPLHQTSPTLHPNPKPFPTQFTPRIKKNGKRTKNAIITEISQNSKPKSGHGRSFDRMAVSMAPVTANHTSAGGSRSCADHDAASVANDGGGGRFGAAAERVRGAGASVPGGAAEHAAALVRSSGHGSRPLDAARGHRRGRHGRHRHSLLHQAWILRTPTNLTKITDAESSSKIQAAPRCNARDPQDEKRDVDMRSCDHGDSLIQRLPFSPSRFSIP